MNKNTVVGITLIGLILIGFSVFNTRQMEKAQVARRVQDSIAFENAQKYAEEIAAARADSIAYAQSHSDDASSDSTFTGYVPTYSNQFLEDAFRKSPDVVCLENDLIKVKLTSKGAQPYSVLIKDYYTCDSTALYLMKEGASSFGVQLFAGQWINTKDFSFDIISSTDTSAVMRLYFADNDYIEHSFHLSKGSYMLDYEANMSGMDKHIPNNVHSYDVQWDMVIPRLEKGYKNEKMYSSLYYHYPEESGVENAGGRGKDAGQKKITTKFNWFAFQQQFFSAILVAGNNFTSGEVSFTFCPEFNENNDLMNCHALASVELTPQNDMSNSFKFYFGPNHYKTLKSYDYRFEKIIPLGGWGVGWINRIIIIPFFDLLNGFVSSYGLIILIMTILLKLVISPLTIKSYMSSAKMNVLKPEVDKIREKYPRQEDAMKVQQETMELYRKANVNMMGGCLPILLQFPVLWAMFRFFPASFELRQQSFLWVKDLSTYDSILDLNFNIPLYGSHVSLFAILVGISMFCMSKLSAKQMDNNPQMAGMKFMTVYFMPVMMLFICNNLSGALCYYYFLSNLFAVAQTWVIRKWFVDEEKILNQIRINTAKNAKRPKSKFQQRLEAMQKAQQEALREQQKRQGRR